MFICECVFSVQSDSDVLIDMSELDSVELFFNDL